MKEGELWVVHTRLAFASCCCDMMCLASNGWMWGSYKGRLVPNVRTSMTGKRGDKVFLIVDDQDSEQVPSSI